MKLLPLAALMLASPLAFAAPSSFTPEQQAELKVLIKQALVEDPEILKEAVVALQQYEEEQAKASQVGLLEKQAKAIFESPNDPWFGAENPKLVMTYFTDFNCPYCKRIEPHLAKLVEEFPELQIKIKMVPLLGESSKEAVDLAQTVWQHEPEKYLKLKKTLMAKPTRLDSASIAQAAKATGTEQWLGKADATTATTINNNMNLMRALGLRGTPSLVFADQIVPGLVDYDQLKAGVEKALAAQE
ncbi:DsbA family protein [Motilimonas cestriensis]|uniref:DsbA family protein n=1 Tax=Motilimonas cestriensis TaxID=2742685 RepID=A0ABS8W666_9GAMM|nr:DsbA family protein [Motilimonas cestriensis]MCE2593867.1 DsbA family protein [Motilimonas cestriensis]